MSVDSSSFGGFGIEIDPEKILDKGNGTGFKTPPVTPAEGIVTDFSIGGFDLVWDMMSKQCFVGRFTHRHASSSGSAEDEGFKPGFMDVTDGSIEAIRKGLEEALTPFGLWEPDKYKFGLWNILHLN